MTKVPSLNGSWHGGATGAAVPSILPEGLELLEARTEEIEQLFTAARRGELPRSRPLKYWEPATLNEQHLNVILMRAGGVRQNRIAKHFDLDQSRVSVILNHPDAQYILDKLGAVHAVDTLVGHRERIAALRGPTLDLIEDFIFDEDVAIEKRVPRAFDLLRLDESMAPKAAPAPVNVSLSVSAGQMGGMLAALRESREIEDAHYVVLADEALEPGTAGVPGGGIEQPGPAKMLLEGDVGGPPHQQSPGIPPASPVQRGEAPPCHWPTFLGPTEPQ